MRTLRLGALARSGQSLAHAGTKINMDEEEGGSMLRSGLSSAGKERAGDDRLGEKPIKICTD